MEEREEEDGYEESIKVKLPNQTKGYLSLLSFKLKILLKTLPEYKKKLIPVMMRLSEATVALKESSSIMWLEKLSCYNKSLNGVSDDIEHRIRESVLENRKTFVLTSGTLALNSDYTYFSKKNWLCRSYK